MNELVEVVERDELQFRFKLERKFVERWLDSGEGPIPQLPHFPGKPVKFHVPTVRLWLLKYHMRGGEGAGTPISHAGPARANPKRKHSIAQ